MDEDLESGGDLVVTTHGRPRSRLVRYRDKPKLVFGRNRDNIRITGDIVSPMPAEWLDTPEEGDEDLF